MFAAEHWLARGGALRTSGGRGTITFMTHDDHRWVLRHYRRGGLAARVLDDTYLWTGEANTRSFVEFNVGNELVEELQLQRCSALIV